MLNSARIDLNHSSEQIQFNILNESGTDCCDSPRPPSQKLTTSNNSVTDEPLGTGNVLCTHDGVLLKKASAEHVAELNNSGSLSLMEYGKAKCLYLEWMPNENILVAADSHEQGEWALVDKISRRRRTPSECKIFNTKPTESTFKIRGIRTKLQELSVIEVKQRRQTIKFMRKMDGSLHTEFFFQHANAELFLSSLSNLHIIEISSPSWSGEEWYEILTNEKQKLKMAFAELDIGEIKSSSLGNEGWLPTRVFGLLASIPDYMGHRSQPKERPTIRQPKERPKLSPPTDNYQLMSISDSIPTSSLATSAEMLTNKEIDYKIVPSLPRRKTVMRGLPLHECQWLQFQTSEGRILNPLSVIETVYRGGIDHRLRKEVWKYLLNFYHWHESIPERMESRKQKASEYYKMKGQWMAMTEIQENNFCGYRDRKNQIEKDVRRTDRTMEYFAGDDNPNLLLMRGILMTYVMYNFDLGYVQGMSDLLAPILATMEDEVDAFWCFVGFMNIVCANFDVDQAGMKSQFNQLRQILEFVNPRLFNYMVANDSDNMYFCFRWLLIWYKREFSDDDVLKLWECLWTQHPCPNYHLIISVAILEQQTDIIIDNKYEFNEILKHVNELSENIDLELTLEIAEAIYYQMKDAKYLPNEIRQIIGEPLLETESIEGDSKSPDQFEDDFDELVKEAASEEQKRHLDSLEEACQRSMFLQHL